MYLDKRRLGDKKKKVPIGSALHRFDLLRHQMLLSKKLTITEFKHLNLSIFFMQSFSLKEINTA